VPDVKSLISNRLSTGLSTGLSSGSRLRSDLVTEGRHAVEAIGSVLEGSMQRVQNDLERRLHTLGFATRADLAAIEHQLARLVALRSQSGDTPAGDPAYREVLRTSISG
jgi:hypothetical protein